MTESFDLKPGLVLGRSSADAGATPTATSAEAQRALERLACHAPAHLVELRVEQVDRGACLARWSCGRRGRSAATRHQERPIAGDPPWRLVAGLAGEGAGAAAAIDLIAMGIGDWRLAATIEGRVARRSEELDLLHALGRAAAEARTTHELYAGAARVLERGLALDLLLAGHLLEGALQADAFLARPWPEAEIRDIALHAANVLGAATVQGPVVFELAVYDEARGMRAPIEVHELVVVPLLCREQLAGCLCAVVGDGADERRLRLLYGAASQISLHLERILTVAAAETDRFRSVLASMPQAVLVLGAEGGLTLANEAARRWLEATVPDAGIEVGRALEQVGLSGVVAAASGGPAPPAQLELRTAAGRDWSATITPLAVADRVEGCVIVLSDVTESRRVQQQLAQSEKMASLGQMVAGIAHELNNPLTSILGYAQLLRGGAGAKLNERLEILHREAERCRKIVRNLLGFVRAREPERKTIALNQVVDGARALLDHQLRMDDIRVEADLARELPAMVGDPHQLEQVLVNLLTNARQALREQSAGGTIRLTTALAASGITLTIADSGPGVPAPVRDRIFEPFFTTKDAGRGTGLGLSLVRNIVVAHGGTIELLDRSPGATFELRFPVPESAPARAQPAATSASGPAPRRAARILVVDDEEHVARMICEALTVEGHQAIMEPDAGRALERSRTEPFDLLIADLRMPRADLRAARVLLTTGEAHLELDRAGAAPDMGDVLHKPFDAVELVHRVRERLLAH